MIIVAGSIQVRPGRRDAFLALSHSAVEKARAAEGCIDFAVFADLVDDERVNIYECWRSAKALEAFRGSGMDSEQMQMIRSGSVKRYAAEEAGAP